MAPKIAKDESVVRMLAALRSELGSGAFDVVDHWESDRCAIGIARPDDHGVVVYISTYERPEDRYWVSLELPPREGDDGPYTPAGEREVRGIRELAAVVRSHFDAEIV